MARAAPAASRAVAIVAFLTSHSSRGFTISELARHLGMNLASAHATLGVLGDTGFVVRDPVHRTYVLGPALAATGAAALDQHPAIGAASARAAELADELGVEATVSALAGKDIILIARRGVEPSGPTVGYPGDRTPLLAPYGAVLMAWADEDSTAAWLERAAVSDSVAKQYRTCLEEIRTRGFSVPMRTEGAPALADAIARLRSQPTDDHAEEEVARALHGNEEMLLSLDGLSASDEVIYKSIAAPIFDPLGRVLLSLGITGPDHLVSLDEVIARGRRVASAAALATSQCGGRVGGPVGTEGIAAR
jgi:DNA-binding IclR family transcriptional regulator